MTLYINYYTVDSPLNEELGPLIQIRKRDLQSDPIHRRMLLILVSVVLTVLAFAMLMLPGRAFSEPETVPEISAQSAAPLPEIEAPIEGALSPVFSAEVQHWAPSILRWASETGLDPDIVATIMQIES